MRQLVVIAVLAACGGGNENVDVRCGNGVVDPNEACDDGNGTDTDGCLSTCQANECGDGVLLSGVELCDDGNVDDTDGCTSSCTTSSCGDGSVQQSEECDDGNATDTDGCHGCLLATCGDGFVQTGVEECDAGSGSNGANNDCLAECMDNVCGDGFVDADGPQTEACDDGDVVTETACPYGMATCTACNADCSEQLALTGNVCGDNTAATPEACDDGNDATETACPYGMATCTACNADCSQLLALTGNVCGDGVKDASEACDDRNTSTCGTCSSDCQMTQSGGNCGDAVGCASGTDCVSGVCLPNSTCQAATCFIEDFSDNSAAWMLGTEWQIGSATVSTGHQQGFPDPGADHSSSSDNGVAGAVIGGNYDIQIHSFYYLTSPVIDLAGIAGAAQLSYWRWLNCDYDPYSTHTVEVFDGIAWVIVWSNASLGNVQVTDSTWQQFTFDVTAYKNSNFRVRFGHRTNKQSTFLGWIMSGWNIDDIVIGSPLTCP
jgi:cysteine-rich repeat protein